MKIALARNQQAVRTFDRFCARFLIQQQYFVSTKEGGGNVYYVYF